MHDISYVLVAGPGRSGSTFIYEYLRAVAPHLLGVIKEQELYKSKVFDKTNRTFDISNRAFLERDDIESFLNFYVPSPNREEVAILYLNRNTLKRSQSITKFRRSRGYITSYLGIKILEKSLKKDFFQPRHVVQNDNVSVYMVDFETLVSDKLCQQYIFQNIFKVDYNEKLLQERINQSVVAKNFFLAATGKATAVILRLLGAKSVLQKLKDNSSVKKLFFDSKSNPADFDFSKNFIEACAVNDANMCDFLTREFTLVASGVYQREN